MKTQPGTKGRIIWPSVGDGLRRDYNGWAQKSPKVVLSSPQEVVNTMGRANYRPMPVPCVQCEAFVYPDSDGNGRVMDFDLDGKPHYCKEVA